MPWLTLGRVGQGEGSHPGVWGDHGAHEELWGRKGTLLPPTHTSPWGDPGAAGVGGTGCRKRRSGSWDEGCAALRGLSADIPSEEPCAFGFGEEDAESRSLG